MAEENGLGHEWIRTRPRPGRKRETPAALRFYQAEADSALAAKTRNHCGAADQWPATPRFRRKPINSGNFQALPPTTRNGNVPCHPRGVPRLRTDLRGDGGVGREGMRGWTGSRIPEFRCDVTHTLVYSSRHFNRGLPLRRTRPSGHNSGGNPGVSSPKGRIPDRRRPRMSRHKNRRRFTLFGIQLY